MSETNDILHIDVGTDLGSTLQRARDTLRTLERGESPAPHFGIGFEDIGQMLAVFTPRRWDLLAHLRAHGPMAVAELARALGRDYKNVHNDVERLMEWLVVEKDDQGRIYTPYREILLDVHLPETDAA